MLAIMYSSFHRINFPGWMAASGNIYCYAAAAAATAAAQFPSAYFSV